MPEKLFSCMKERMLEILCTQQNCPCTHARKIQLFQKKYVLLMQQNYPSSLARELTMNTTFFLCIVSMMPGNSVIQV